MLVTERIKASIKESCLKDLRSIGIYDIDSCINADTDLDYIGSLGLSEYIGLTQEDFIKKVHELDTADEKELSRVGKLVQNANKLSIYWILCNGVRFAIDLDAVIQKNFEPDEEFMKLLSKSKTEDFIFDFYGDNVKEQCRFQKQHDLIRIKGKFYTHWIFSYCRMAENDDFGTMELCIIPELFPRMFVLDTRVSDMCKKCGICPKVEDACFKHQDGSIDSSIIVMRMPKNLQYTLESNCEYKHITNIYGPFLKHNIRDYYNACLYAVSKYLKRKTIVKQGDDSEVTKFMKVAVPKEHNPSEVTFVTLHDRVKYERKRRRQSQGHHASPREHFRRETERHLKDGRVIKVRGCVINKGKGDVKKQTVYKIT